MAYDRVKIFEQAKEMIVKHKLFFVEDIVSFLPISKTTFYEYFTPDSNETNILKELLEQQRVTLKVGMRSKWYKSDNPTLQVSLMKLICTDDERKKLSMHQAEEVHQDDKITEIKITRVNGNKHT